MHVSAIAVGVDRGRLVVPGRSGPVGRTVVARRRVVVRGRVDDPGTRVVVAVVPHHADPDRAVATTEQHSQDEQDREAIALH